MYMANAYSLCLCAMFYPTAPGLFSSIDMLDFGTLRTMGKPTFKS